MFPIREARWLGPDVRWLRIEAPWVPRRWRAGQFVIVRVHEHGERIPLTIADADPSDGTIVLIVQGVGKTTRLLNALEPGDILRDVVGPLGEPSEIERFGRVVVIGGGVGTAIAYPTAVALQKAGNQVVGILGARHRGLLILENEMRQTCDTLLIMTDDGSYGQRGLVTHKLQELIETGPSLDRVLAIGPIPMMRAVAETTRPHAIPTIVSLNPVMVDGTGMCGGCRVLVGGASRFACVDGPEFDAHQVDFTNLMQRNAMYRQREQEALAQFTENPSRDLEEVHRCRLQETHPQAGPGAGMPSDDG